ncbi:MAG: microcin C transport system substrate-binding protein [Gammaproteobacteria bacterium]|jgi:microcin C transport system substrate-binding protein
MVKGKSKTGFSGSLSLLLILLLAACSNNEDVEKNLDSELAPDNTAEVKDFYGANSEFFSFKSLTDLPHDLVWENGSELPEFGSPNAIKGGTQYSSLQDFPRTLRHVGPDSNGSFRRWILDDVSMSVAQTHPNHRDKFYPGLATQWAISSTRKTTYIKLNPLARWSDGVKVTADDYLFSFFFYRSTNIVAPWYNNWYSTMYTNITKYDDYTISISIPNVKPDMHARTLSLSPTPQHFYKELGDDFVERYQWRFVPTTGAYQIKPSDIKKGRSITLSKVDNWWANDLKFWRYRFNANKIQFNIIRDNAKVFESFQRGDIDQFGLNLAEYWYDKLSDNHESVAKGYIHKTTFYNQHPRPTYGLWINSSKPILNQKEVRIGINHAANWGLVIEKYFRSDYERLRSSADGYGEFTHPTLTPRRFDIKLALKHFKLAGFTTRNEDGILVNGNQQKLAFTLTTGYEALKDVLTILKEEAAKAGLELRIEVLDGTAAWKKAQEKKHDILFSAFGVGLEMYPRYWETYHSVNAYDQAFLADGSTNPERKVKTQSNNLELVADPKIDAMINQYRASSDKQEMINLAHKLDEALFDYASFSPGFKQSYFRTGYWRWLKHPKGFSQKHRSGSTQLFTYWIDQEAKKETLEARQSGLEFDPEIEVFDQYRQDSKSGS